MFFGYRKFRDYFRTPSDVLLYLSILSWAVLLPLLIRRHGMKELLEFMSPRRIRARRRTRRIVVFVNWWLNRNILMFRPTCLNRSLLLYRFLTMEGLPVRIHYGIRKAENGPDGHSWLTLNSKPFLQDGMTADLYRETFVFPGENKALK